MLELIHHFALYEPASHGLGICFFALGKELRAEHQEKIAFAYEQFAPGKEHFSGKEQEKCSLVASNLLLGASSELLSVSSELMSESSELIGKSSELTANRNLLGRAEQIAP